MQNLRAFARHPEAPGEEWRRTEMWAYVHVSFPVSEALAKKAFCSHDKDDLLAFVKAYVHEDDVLREGVSEDQFIEALETCGYDWDVQDCHLVKQIKVHSSNGDFRGPLMILYWYDGTFPEGLVKYTKIHAFADVGAIKDWSLEHLRCPHDAREKVLAAALNNESICLPPGRDRGVFKDGGCLVCDCPILCKEDDRDELSSLLDDMISVEPGRSGTVGLERELCLERTRPDDMWTATWKPDKATVLEFPAASVKDAERHRGGIYKTQAKKLQSYRMIKGIMQRFDRVEQAIEQLTGEMRFLPPVHGGAEYWKTSRRFGKGYRSE